MTSCVNVTEAKAKFSEVVERASRGEEIIVMRMGKPVVKISRYQPGSARKRLGLFAGQISISDDFDDWPDEIAKSFGIID